MKALFRNRGLAQAGLVLFFVSLSSGGFAADLDGARLIPKGKVSIYDGSEKVGELSSEAPVPMGRVLVPSEKCGVRLDGVYLVAGEKTRFSIRETGAGADLYVEAGRVYFALGAMRDVFTLSTPQDTVTVQNGVIGASVERPLIKGYLAFEKDRMEIGVLEGGSLVVANARGRQVIEPGNSLHIQLAQAELGAGAAAAASGGGGSLGSLAVGGGMVGTGVGGMAAMGSFDGSDGPPPEPEDASAFRP